MYLYYERSSCLCNRKVRQTPRRKEEASPLTTLSACLRIKLTNQREAGTELHCRHTHGGHYVHEQVGTPIAQAVQRQKTKQRPTRRSGLRMGSDPRARRQEGPAGPEGEPVCGHSWFSPPQEQVGKVLSEGPLLLGEAPRSHPSRQSGGQGGRFSGDHRIPGAFSSKGPRTSETRTRAVHSEPLHAPKAP